MKLSEKYTKTPGFLTIDKYLRPIDKPISGHPEARSPRIVPFVNYDYGNPWAAMKQLRYIGRYLTLAIIEMSKGVRSIKMNPYSGKTQIDDQTLDSLETYAKNLGVSDIGYARVNTRYIFKHSKILFSNAIVFAIEMDRDKIDQAPNVTSLIEIFRTYYQVGIVVNRICGFLRERGYNCNAGPAVASDVNYIPVAIDAGIGYSGKNGLLIMPKNGPRIRLAAVFTDIENLPFKSENEHLWVRDYCQSCNICIKKCPSGAIYNEPRILDDGGPAFIDHTKCAIPFSNDNGCSLCIKFCPFSAGRYNKIKRDFLI